MDRIPTTIVEDRGEYGTTCGYCKSGSDTSYAYGMWCHQSTVADYQELLDRGWRRSGCYLYKPDLPRTCCRLYTIRLHAVSFAISRAQHKVLRRMERYLAGTWTPTPAVLARRGRGRGRRKWGKGSAPGAADDGDGDGSDGSGGSKGESEGESGGESGSEDTYDFCGVDSDGGEQLGSQADGGGGDRAVRDGRRSAVDGGGGAEREDHHGGRGAEERRQARDVGASDYGGGVVADASALASQRPGGAGAQGMGGHAGPPAGLERLHAGPHHSAEGCLHRVASAVNQHPGGLHVGEHARGALPLEVQEGARAMDVDGDGDGEGRPQAVVCAAARDGQPSPTHPDRSSSPAQGVQRLLLAALRHLLAEGSLAFPCHPRCPCRSRGGCAKGDARGGLADVNAATAGHPGCATCRAAPCVDGTCAPCHTAPVDTRVSRADAQTTHGNPARASPALGAGDGLGARVDDDSGKGKGKEAVTISGKDGSSRGRAGKDSEDSQVKEDGNMVLDTGNSSKRKGRKSGTSDSSSARAGGDQVVDAQASCPRCQLARPHVVPVPPKLRTTVGRDALLSSSWPFAVAAAVARAQAAARLADADASTPRGPASANAGVATQGNHGAGEGGQGRRDDARGKVHVVVEDVRHDGRDNAVSGADAKPPSARQVAALLAARINGWLSSPSSATASAIVLPSATTSSAPAPLTSSSVPSSSSSPSLSAAQPSPAPAPSPPSLMANGDAAPWLSRHSGDDVAAPPLVPVEHASALLLAHVSAATSLAVTDVGDAALLLTRVDVGDSGHLNFVLSEQAAARVAAAVAVEAASAGETHTPSPGHPAAKGGPGSSNKLLPERAGTQPGTKHVLEISTHRAAFSRESYELYRRYQVAVHNESPSKASERSFTRFLVDTPLDDGRGADDAPPTPAPSCGFGSFHQHYRIDGKLVAVGVVDILPRCLSSKYLFWDPDYAFLSLGKFTALKEIEWVASQAATCPSVAYYYLGFYVHTCPKMRYKAAYEPSELLCPKNFVWVPYSDVRVALDMQPYCVFSELPGVGEADGPEQRSGARGGSGAAASTSLSTPASRNGPPGQARQRLAEASGGAGGRSDERRQGAGRQPAQAPERETNVRRLPLLVQGRLTNVEELASRRVSKDFLSRLTAQLQLMCRFVGPLVSQRLAVVLQ